MVSDPRKTRALRKICGRYVSRHTVPKILRSGYFASAPSNDSVLLLVTDPMAH
jgi:hypothetical protein